ncbi:hypothetical protein DPM33_33360 [Mesorhizobium hawassense]|uniref:Uncharacterized protein n=1 Tax=Mesorhizobium hawassense TaxID=1209954 RepID=A0A330H3T3_9HYPH|nr:hypothetical protein DPM33_33360 [Mesorhizobium hawassense]
MPVRKLVKVRLAILKCLAKPRLDQRPGKPVAWRKRNQMVGETAENLSRLHGEWRVPQIRCYRLSVRIGC